MDQGGGPAASPPMPDTSIDPLQETVPGHDHDIIGDIDRIDGLNMSPTKHQPPKGHADMGGGNGSSQENDLLGTVVPDASVPVRARVFALADDGNWEDLATGVFALADDYVNSYNCWTCLTDLFDSHPECSISVSLMNNHRVSVYSKLKSVSEK